MRDIPKASQLSSFVRVITSSFHAKVLELQAKSFNWDEFVRGLLEINNFHDSLKMGKKDITIESNQLDI